MNEAEGRGLNKSGSETMASVASVDAAEVSVIRQTQWGGIREMWSRGMSKKGIARELQIDVKTVKKWLKQDWVSGCRSSGSRPRSWAACGTTTEARRARA